MSELRIAAGLSLDREAFLAEQLRQAGLADWWALARQHWNRPEHGDFPRWQATVAALPNSTARSVTLDADCPTLGAATEIRVTERDQIEQGLRALIPWRKGPFEVFGIAIDAEWRSDQKWNRLRRHITPLAGRRVLDVGSNNGYYLLRMVGAGAKLALGVEPSWLAHWQFNALSRFLPATLPAWMIPGRCHEVPAGIFDSVFSMGVLYHRKDPLTHLRELHAHLRPGGELILETLIAHEASFSVAERYANMRNIYLIPTENQVQQWLIEAGFRGNRLIHQARTETDEQRSTAWMPFHSLNEALDPQQPQRTREGHPAPRRACFIAHT